jgi:hypothetical protein
MCKATRINLAVDFFNILVVSDSTATTLVSETLPNLAEFLAQNVFEQGKKLIRR